LASPRLEIVSRDGSKDTSKRDNHISANRRRLDRLDDKRGRDQLPRPESKHQTRRPRTLRDILRPRGTTRFQGNRRLQNTRTRLEETLRSSLGRTTRTTNPRPHPRRNSLERLPNVPTESPTSASFIAKRHEVER